MLNWNLYGAPGLLVFMWKEGSSNTWPRVADPLSRSLSHHQRPEQLSAPYACRLVPRLFRLHPLVKKCSTECVTKVRRRSDQKSDHSNCSPLPSFSDPMTMMDGLYHLPARAFKIALAMDCRYAEAPAWAATDEAFRRPPPSRGGRVTRRTRPRLNLPLLPSTSFMSDFDVMLARKKAQSGRRRRNRDGGTFISDADDVVSAMITKMTEAAEVSSAFQTAVSAPSIGTAMLARQADPAVCWPCGVLTLSPFYRRTEPWTARRSRPWKSWPCCPLWWYTWRSEILSFALPARIRRPPSCPPPPSPTLSVSFTPFPLRSFSQAGPERDLHRQRRDDGH